MNIVVGVLVWVSVIAHSGTAWKTMSRPGTCPAPYNYHCSCYDICHTDAGCSYPKKCCLVDKCGCKVCRNPCPDLDDCHKTCRDGYQTGTNGCEICQCINVCEGVDCPTNQKCLAQEVQCVTAPCRRQGVCVCSGLEDCDLICPDGFRKDGNGCEACQCIDVCEDDECPPGTVCVPEMIPCDEAPNCPSKAVCVCPDLPCDLACPYGLKKDANGCEICECIDVCEGVKCPENQRCVPKKTSCPTAPNCPHEGVCECIPLTCKRACRDGFRTDENGCEVCKCKDICEDFKCPKGKKCEPQEIKSDIIPPPRQPVCVPDCSKVICALYCEDGFQTDNNGCPICKCVDVCEDVECPYGETCEAVDIECVTTPCPPRLGQCVPCKPQLCELFCRDGFKKDSNGCELCECRDLCEGVKCHKGETCKPVEIKCDIVPPPRKPVCVPDCDDFICALFCEDGFQKDKNNCPICKCVDVCEDVDCPYKQTCVPVTVFCVTTPCPRKGECQPCPLVRCGGPCPLGFKVTKDGCQTCTCKDVCDDFDCPNGKHCEIIPGHDDCPPQPKCVLNNKRKRPGLSGGKQFGRFGW